MNILVLNCGSSSVKYQLIEVNDRKWLARVATVPAARRLVACARQRRTDRHERCHAQECSV